MVRSAIFIKLLFPDGKLETLNEYTELWFKYYINYKTQLD